MNTTTEYEMCGRCRHFVEPNDVDDETRRHYAPGELAEYVHLDNGEKDHDHDATPSGVRGTLDAWRKDDPGLFVTYPDGETGPNSAHYRHGGKS